MHDSRTERGRPVGAGAGLLRGAAACPLAVARLPDRITGPRRPTALVTTDSSMTLGAVRAARRLGLRLPQDVSLVGIDDADWMPVLVPPM